MCGVSAAGGPTSSGERVGGAAAGILHMLSALRSWEPHPLSHPAVYNHILFVLLRNRLRLLLRPATSWRTADQDVHVSTVLTSLNLANLSSQ